MEPDLLYLHEYNCEQSVALSIVVNVALRMNMGVRGMPERDIESLGVMGKGAGGGQEILPPPPSSPSSPTESGCLIITRSFVF